MTQYLARDFEVHDGLGVVYVRAGHSRVARLVSDGLAARIYSDLAPLGAPDGRITAGDAWVSGAASRGILGVSAAPSPVDRLLLSSARRLLYETVARTTWFGRDHLGSVTMETDESGGVVGRRRFAPFGATLSSLGDADRYGFTSQETDGTGMLRFQFRQLDGVAGRWSSPDPLFASSSAKTIAMLGQSSTAMAYVANTPINFADPSGLVVEKGPQTGGGPKKSNPKPPPEVQALKRKLGKVGRQASPRMGGNCLNIAIVADQVIREHFMGIDNQLEQTAVQPITSIPDWKGYGVGPRDYLSRLLGSGKVFQRYDSLKSIEADMLGMEDGARGIISVGFESTGERHVVNVLKFRDEVFIFNVGSLSTWSPADSSGLVDIYFLRTNGKARHTFAFEPLKSRP